LRCLKHLLQLEHTEIAKIADQIALLTPALILIGWYPMTRFRSIADFNREVNFHDHR
jgi:hypothetical protein